ncbi:MAG: FHA domain-containing protein [Magnetococcales bacterium]|nr:FHA domain-containing protein [Magnetococcales bacterium]
MRKFFRTLLNPARKPTEEKPTDDPKDQESREDGDCTVLFAAGSPGLSAPIHGASHTPVSSLPLPSSMASCARLIDQREAGGLGEFPLTSAVTMVSRKTEWGMSNADLLLINDAGISRNHAIIELRGSQFCLRDLGSANGTYLNGKSLKTETPLQNGDIIRFHKFSFRFVLADMN